MRSSKNTTNHDNWSTRGNTNPDRLRRTTQAVRMVTAPDEPSIQTRKEDNIIGTILEVRHTSPKEQTMALPSIITRRQEDPILHPSINTVTDKIHYFSKMDDITKVEVLYLYCESYKNCWVIVGC